MRKGMAVGQGKGYKNIVIRDPFVHRLSAKGIKTRPLGIKMSPLVTNVRDFLKTEATLAGRYTVLKSEERIPAVRNIRLRQLERKKKFLEVALSHKYLDVKKHVISDMIQGYREKVILQNRYGKKVVNIQTTQGEQRRQTDNMMTYAEVHRVDKSSSYWKKLRQQLKTELRKTDEDIAIAKGLEAKQGMKKAKKKDSISFGEAMKMTPLGQLLNTGSR